ncbi:uncharacterized protein PRCAT00003367001 [Priceomyces carsonii]|uniref:uncharacterized protein n=1 Tax=Priceomyces carsonii TaxID=28549 RepID=UPI002ED89681|nr:unnamed protein product [Priceomyces carsonii]
MDRSSDDTNFKELNSFELSSSRSSSPSDLSSSSPKNGHFSSSPILSNLSLLFSNLRANDGKVFDKDMGSAESDNSAVKIGRAALKFLNDGKSLEDLAIKQSHITRRRSSLIKNRLLDKGGNVIEETNSEVDNILEFNSQFLKSVGPIKIPGSFVNEGISLLKVSHKSKKRINLKLDTKSFNFMWKNAFNSASMPTSSSLQRLIGSATPYPLKSKVYVFSVDDIRSIIFQSDAANYREELHISKGFEDQWITIVYFNAKKGKLKSLHLVADTEHEFRKLCSIILSLVKLRDDLAKNFFIDLNDMDEDQRNLIFQKADENGEKSVRQYLTFDDILKYSKRLHMNMNDSYLKEKFDLVASGNETSDKSLGLNFEQFKKFVSILKRRDDIDEVWSSICGKNKTMGYDLFKHFTANIQKETFSEEQLLKLFTKFCMENKDYWRPENFNNFLLSKYSSPLHNLGDDVEYFSHPLNEYYISSSHNTYLTGRQFVGESSVEGYIKALQRGCRCVEIDVWDGTDDMNSSHLSEPVVCHGRSFTTAILFENVIKTIKKYAFQMTPFPLILSLEIHCSPNNQLKVVKILEDILGEALISKPIEDRPILPSPMQLKHRILVKVKKTSPFINLITENGLIFSSSTSTSTTTSFSEDNNSSRSSFIQRKTRSTKILDDLSSLGIYLQGLKFRNFSLPESKTHNHCFSLGEKSVNAMLKDDTRKASIDKHNRKYFMRVYPSKIRLKSSNFSPIPYWSHGVQMVATNWQTYDLGQQLNESMFQGVRENGFVLKPQELRKPLIKSVSSQTLPKESISTKHMYRFSLEVISAHQLPRPKGSLRAINPFITVEIIGANKIDWDSNSFTRSTPIVAENGFNPTWNAVFSGSFRTTNDLVFLRLIVNSSSSPLEETDVNTIGIEVVKLSQLKQGLRYLPINDPLGEALLYSSLFVKINYSIS